MVDIGLKLAILLEDIEMRLDIDVLEERPVEDEGEADRGVGMSEFEGEEV